MITLVNLRPARAVKQFFIRNERAGWAQIIACVLAAHLGLSKGFQTHRNNQWISEELQVASTPGPRSGAHAQLGVKSLE
jgi:hypothetical protein